MTDLVVIVPSRGRPTSAIELAEAFEATCTADTELVFALDKDDPTLPDYKGLLALIRENSSMVQALNVTALEVTNGPRAASAVGFMGDDHRPRTAGWDQAYLDALRELGTGIVYGNDLLQGENIPTQVAMTSDIIRTLGYMAPPDLIHLYVDNAWLALGRELGRIRYLPDVVVEHLHPVVGKADWDEGYARVNHPGMYDKDRATFERWLRESLPAETARLRRIAR